MSFDRRRFLEVAGFAGAGLLIGCSKEAAKPEPTTTPAQPPAKPPDAPPSGISLSLLLWGSALYAFSNGGKSVEVAYLIDDPKVPGCTFVPHQPMLMFPVGGARFVPEKSTIKLEAGGGNIPKGVWKISAGSLRSGAGVLEAVGLNDNAVECAESSSALSSLGFVPTLKAKTPSNVAANWRGRFATRFSFGHGKLSAHAPFHAEAALPRWETRGPVAGTPLSTFTDTLELTIPLAGNSVTFENERNETITLETHGDPDRIEARLMAHPEPSNDEPLRAGDKEPHFCALYAAFDPIPAPADRAEIFFKDWCPGARGTAPPSSVPTGPSPGRFCTGGKIEIPS